MTQEVVHAATTLEGEYVEGEAIVCVASDGISMQAEDADGLLAGANPLMALDAQEREVASYALGEEADTSQEVLMLVQSDALDTESLIDELSELPDVVYAEPNYIYHCEEVDYSDRQWSGTSEYGMNIPGWNSYKDRGTVLLSLIDYFSLSQIS